MHSELFVLSQISCLYYFFAHCEIEIYMYVFTYRNMYICVYLYLCMHLWMHGCIYLFILKGVDEIGTSFTIVVLIVQRLQNICEQSFVMFLDC